MNLIKEKKSNNVQEKNDHSKALLIEDSNQEKINTQKITKEMKKMTISDVEINDV